MTELDPKSAAVVAKLEQFERVGPRGALGEGIQDAVCAPLRSHSLKALYEQLADEVYGFLAAFLGEQGLALEVLEETFFRADQELRKTGGSLGLADVLRFARDGGLEARRLLDKAREPGDDGALVVVPATRALLLERTGLGLSSVELAEARATSSEEVQLALRAAGKELSRSLVPPAHEGGDTQLELLTRRAAGVATEAEQRTVSEHVSGCAVCAVLAERLREVCEVPLVAVEDPAATWRRIEQRIERVRAHHEAVARAALKVSLGCCYCHDAVRREESVYCASCLAPHHADCFSEHGRCSAPGCHEERCVRPGAKAEPEPRRRLQVPSWVWAGIGGGLVAAAAFSAGWTGGSSSDVVVGSGGKAQEWQAQMRVDSGQARQVDSSQAQQVVAEVQAGRGQLGGLVVMAGGDGLVDQRQTMSVSVVGDLEPDRLPRPVYAGRTVEGWIERLYDYSPDARKEAVGALASLGQAAVPELIEALDGAKDGVRRAAADALAGMESPATDAIPSLIRAVGSKDSSLRASAVVALGAMGKAGGPAAEVLAVALTDSSVDVREQAVYALRQIGDGSEPTIAALIRALSDSSRRVRRGAAGALQAIGPRAEAAAGPLSDAMVDEESGVREAVAKALGAVGSRAPSAVGALRRALFDESTDVVAAAVHSLGELDAENNLSNLIGALLCGDSDVRREVVRVLVKLGIGAVPQALEALERDDYRIASGAGDALRRIGVRDEQAFELMVASYEQTGSEALRRVLERIAPLRSWVRTPASRPAPQTADAAEASTQEPSEQTKPEKN